MRKLFVIFCVVMSFMCFSANGVFADETTFSGERTLICTFDRSDLNNFVDGGYNSFEEALNEIDKSRYNCNIEKLKRDVKITISFSFESKDEYESYLKELLGYRPVVIYQTGENFIFAENFEAGEMLNIVQKNLLSKNRLKELKFDSLLNVENCTMTLNEKNHETKQNFDVRNNNQFKYDDIDIISVAKNDGTFERTIKVNINIIDVSITGSTCAYVNKKGEMYVMGYPRVSFGDKDNTRESSTPVKIMDNVIDVELSTNNDYGQTFAAITKNNELYMWGDNSHGIINPNTEEPIDQPTKVMDNVKSVSIGDGYVLAVTTSNELYAWGYNRFGKLGIGNTETPSEKVKVMDNVLLADAGTNTSLAVNLNGELFTWGHNSYGCLGQGIDFEEDDNDVLLPTKIMSNVKSASLDESTMIILDKNGDVYTCGWNTRGQLGTGDTDDRNVPTLIYNIYNSATTENE